MLNCSRKHLTAQATVLTRQGDKVSISLDSEKKASCQQCKNKGGCQSLSLNQYFIKDKPLQIPHSSYKAGDKLSLQLPEYFLIYSLLLLIATPLFGFILIVALFSAYSEPLAYLLGLFVASTAVFICKKQLTKKLLTNLTIHKIN